MLNIIAFITDLESKPFFAAELLGNTVYRWLLSAIIFLLLYLGSRFLCSVVVSVYTRSAQASKNKFDDLFIPVLQSIRRSLLAVVSVCVALKFINLPEKIETFLDAVLIFSLLIQGGFSGSRFFDNLLKSFLSSTDEDSAKNSAMGLIGFVGRVVIWALILVIFLDNLGVNITGLIAGLGVGGIAVALAVQNILGDLLASLSIILDKPFHVGDFIIVDEVKGTVERIGIKTTRLKSISGEQLVLSNSDLLKSRIRNFKKMYERRVVFEIGVTYQTSPEALGKISKKVREVIESLQDLRFDRVHFKSFGNSALIFEIVYFVLSADYLLYMDRQEQINLELLEYFNSQGIEFAYPTQTIFLEKTA